MTVRVAVWNLHGSAEPEWTHRRLATQLGVLSGLDADVLILLEAKALAADPDRKVLHRIRSRLGGWGCVVASNHHGCDLVLVVREHAGLFVRREHHDRAALWWHAQAAVELSGSAVEDQDGKGLWVLGEHLAPSNPDVRALEAGSSGLWRRRRVIRGGDYNAAPTSHRPDRERAARLGKLDKLDTRAAEAIERARFLDVGAYLSPSGCQSATVGHSGSSYAYPADRIYTNLPPDACVSFQTGGDPAGLSDHAWVTADFEPTTTDSDRQSDDRSAR